MDHLPDLTSENKVLREQAESLKKDFVELYEKWNYMLIYDEPLLTSLYLIEIGELRFIQFRALTELEILKQRIKLAQAYFNRNELPDWTRIDVTLFDQEKEYAEKIELEAKKQAAAREYLNKEFLNELDAIQLKHVYRQLVKVLHPDLNPIQTDEEREMFVKVQAAYQLCNLQVLNELLLIHGNGQSISTVALPDLSAEVKHLSARLNSLQEKVDRLNLSFPFFLRDKLQDPDWLAAEKESLENMIEISTNEIDVKNEYLLLLESWRPELLN